MEKRVKVAGKEIVVRRRPKGHKLAYLMIFMVCFATGALIGINFKVEEKPIPVVTLSMAYGSEKKKWIRDTTQDFQVYAFAKSGILVLCDFAPMGSRKMAISTLTGEIKPTIVSPASSIWIPYMNYKAMSIGGHPMILNYTKVIYSPVVIGTWRWFNETWGAVGGIKGFDTLLQIPGRFAHTDPQLSNSGAMSVLMMVATFLGKDTSNITYADLFNPITRLKMLTIEQKCTYYGHSTGFLGKKALDGTLDIFMVYESVIIDNNKKDLAKARGGMVAVYPENGTLYSDHPFAILTADWVTPLQAFAGKLYLDFIKQPSIIEKAFKRGFRPINNDLLNGTKYKGLNDTFAKYFKESNGVVANISHIPEFVGEVNPFILDQIPELWNMVRAK